MSRRSRAPALHPRSLAVAVALILCGGCTGGTTRGTPWQLSGPFWLREEHVSTTCCDPGPLLHLLLKTGDEFQDIAEASIHSPLAWKERYVAYESIISASNHGVWVADHRGRKAVIDERGWWPAKVDEAGVHVEHGDKSDHVVGWAEVARILDGDDR